MNAAATGVGAMDRVMRTAQREKGTWQSVPLRRGIRQLIVLLATFDSELSLPALVYALTAKYQVPAASCSTT
jgi:hypothetical protein